MVASGLALVFGVLDIVNSGLAGLAGALLAPITSVYATIGGDVIINAFIVVVAGGMGNFRGAALVSLLLGEVESVGAIFGLSAYTVALLTQQNMFNPLVILVAAILAGLAMSVVFGIYTNVASGIEYMML